MLTHAAILIDLKAPESGPLPSLPEALPTPDSATAPNLGNADLSAKQLRELLGASKPATPFLSSWWNIPNTFPLASLISLSLAEPLQAGTIKQGFLGGLERYFSPNVLDPEDKAPPKPCKTTRDSDGNLLRECRIEGEFR